MPSSPAFAQTSASADPPLSAVFYLRLLAPLVLALLLISSVVYPALKALVLGIRFRRSGYTPILEGEADADAHAESPIVPVIIAVREPRRGPFYILASLAALSYAADAGISVAHALVLGRWEGQGREWVAQVVHDVGSLATFAAFVFLLATRERALGAAAWGKRNAVFAGVALVFEVALLGLWAAALSHGVPTLTPYNIAHLTFSSARVLALFLLVIIILSPRTAYLPAQPPRTASSPSALESGDGAAAHPNEQSALKHRFAKQYGTLNASGSDITTGGAGGSSTAASTAGDSPGGAGEQEKAVKDKEGSGFKGFVHRLSILFPILWPAESIKLQLTAFFCFCLLMLGRVVNALVPIELGEVIADLSGRNAPWGHLAIYVGLRFFQGSGGLLQVIQNICWIPLMQFTDSRMSFHCFTHLLNLSLAFHTHRKTGEILRILDKGAALNNFFQMLLFNILPVLLDIFVALGYFLFKFGPLLSGLIFAIMFAYGYVSVMLTKWRTQLRRDMVQKDTATRAIYTDALLNYETIKYFTAEAHETNRYRKAFDDFQTVERQVITSLYTLNLSQNIIITLGLTIGSVIVAYRVTTGEAQPAEFVVFLTFLSQLYAPLNQLGMLYRSINTSLVDSEKLMKLLNEPTDINDKPGAPDLAVSKAEIEFKDVRFSYDDKVDALKGISFKVPPGASVALVGESGSGKSTILRLLYRFYDIKEGSILVDGQDIRDVGQISLRKNIAIIPQDCALFNETIAFNLRYGKGDGATDEEIIRAAKAAQMHDRISTFPDGYETKVGERGVRLSGGEKQRIAIARALLKNAPVLCLDEATSALDTNTEREIQGAFASLAEGRSTLIVAHRLSTIAKADLILFVKDGVVVEQGTHSELLALNGYFAEMWAKQVEGEAQEMAQAGMDAEEIQNALGSLPTSPASPHPHEQTFTSLEAQPSEQEKVIAEQEAEAGNVGKDQPDIGVAEAPAPPHATHAPEPEAENIFEAPAAAEAPAVEETALEEPTKHSRETTASSNGTAPPMTPSPSGGLAFPSTEQEPEDSVTGTSRESRIDDSSSVRTASPEASRSITYVDSPPAFPRTDSDERKKRFSAQGGLRKLGRTLSTGASGLKENLLRRNTASPPPPESPTRPSPSIDSAVTSLADEPTTSPPGNSAPSAPAASMSVAQSSSEPSSTPTPSTKTGSTKKKNKSKKKKKGN